MIEVIRTSIRIWEFLGIFSAFFFGTAQRVYLVELTTVGRLATHREKSGSFTLVWEKSGRLGKGRETLVCLWCGTAVAIIAEYS